ncbi:DUF724 domain-containing protein 3 [Linum grandiflorum]
MVSEANPEAHHQFPLFQHGDPVEVSTDEEGFAGAWFPASIVDSNASRKSNSKRKKKKVVVRYDTLLKEDGRTPLTESVDPAFVRPIPPGDDGDAKRGFEVNDLVDAKDKDGWWSGVVAKVLQGGKRYRVLFYNPPDFIDCGENDLRFHWDWIFGKWVRPNKLTPSKGEGIFDPGADVEVNLDKETVGDTWLSAVVIERSSDQTFLVKCQGLDSLDDDAEVLATKEDVVVVDLQHIRPTPPCHSCTGYELLDHVDGLIAGSWRKGLITEVTKGKYTIFFKQREEEKVLSLSKLRPHLDWDDGEWKSKSNAASKGLVVALTNTEKLDSGDTSADNLQLAVVPVSPGASYDNINEKNPYSSITRIKMDESTLSAEKSASNLFASSNKKRKVIPDISGKQLSHCDSLMEGDTEETPLSVRRQNQSSNQKGTSSFTVEKNLRGLVKRQKERLSNAKSSPDRNRLSTKTKKRRGNLVDLDCQKPAMVVYSSKKNPAMVASIGRYTKAPVGSSLVSAADKEDSPENRTSTLVNNGEDVLKEDAVPLILGLGEGRMSHSSNSSPSRAGDRLNSLGDKKRGSESSGEGSLERSDGRKRGRALKYSAKDVKMDAGCMSLETSDTESDGKKIVVKAVTDEVGRQLVLELESTVNEADTSLVGAPEGVAEDDQPLLSSWGRFASPISTHEDRLSTPSVNGCHGRKKSQSVSTDSDALLFVKKSPLWASLEAMDIFRNVPQRPHFLPLKHCEEKYREGVAVGIMVTFGNIFEEISSLMINHSTESLQSSLKSLSEFESYGFDVSVLRRRINKLQTMKSQHIEWLTEAENAERELDEHVEEQRKSEAVLKELEEKMLALQQLVASAKGDMEAKVARGVLLGAHVDKIKARIGYASSAFERVAKSPWRVQG